MLTLYTWPTPNGRKISIMLEETSLPNKVVPVDIRNDEQFAPDFLKISPNNKIPAIVDGDVSIFESGAILIYLADKADQFLPKSGAARQKVMEWLFWQVGGLGPMLGQVGYFSYHDKGPRNEAAIARYTKECERLPGVMEKRLSAHDYLAGDYSIADIACYPWMVNVTNPERLKPALGHILEKSPAIRAWMARLAARPAVQRGMDIPKI